MKITELFQNSAKDIVNTKKPTIAFLGDSVTQGCFDIYIDSSGQVQTYFEQKYAYHRYVADILSMFYPNVPVNIINAGISGGTATGGLKRLDRDVLQYKPDLTVVCFGLNDSTLGGDDGIKEYCDSLFEIFTSLKQSGSEIIFMTPNMMNTHISCHTPKELKSVAQTIMQVQNSGMLDKYIEKAKEVAKSCDVRVCDVYSKWKLLHENGVDTTELLANKVNHPTHEMNMLFAYSLVEEMMK